MFVGGVCVGLWECVLWGVGVYVVVVCPYEGLYVWGDACVRLWGCGVSMCVRELL